MATFSYNDVNNTNKELTRYNTNNRRDSLNPESRFPFVFSMPIQFYTQYDAIEYLSNLSKFSNESGNTDAKENFKGGTEDDAVDKSIFVYRATRDSYDATLRDALTSAPPPDPIKLENTTTYNIDGTINTTTSTNDLAAARAANIGLDPIFTRPNQSTTELGGNDAINCYWQFSWDDDLVPPMLSGHNFQIAPSTGGLGRVYSEMYDNNQQLLHISVGIPKYTNLVRFYTKLFSSELAQINYRGDGFCNKLGKLIGNGLAIPFEIVAFPFRFAMRLINYVTNDRITRYVEFEESMLLYYRYVNSALIELAINMGLMPKIIGKDNDQISTNGSQSNIGFRDLLEEIIPSVTTKEAEESAMFPIFKGGFDLYKILSIRDARERPNSAKPEIYGPNTNDEMEGTTRINPDTDQEEVVHSSKWFPEMTDRWKAFISRSVASWQGADKFISFKLEKSTDSGESLSNSTGESPVSQFFNNNSSMARSGRQFLGGGNPIKIAEDLLTSIPLLGDIAKGGIDFTKGLYQSAIGGKLDAATGPFAVLGGEASVDIPEVWQSSSFSKSHNFNVTLRSPYGDPYSIFTNVYIPLIMLLCMALPRAVGFSSYIQPFVLRAYSKGMFAIPYGIIDSMSIKRGASEFGWSKQRLPTVVEVSFTIKDLSPYMVMGMDIGATPISAVTDPLKTLDKLFRENTNFQEYLMTISGMGLVERLLLTNNIKRRLTAVFKEIKSLANPNYLGHFVGNSRIGKIIGAFSPYTRFPD